MHGGRPVLPVAAIVDDEYLSAVHSPLGLQRLEPTRGERFRASGRLGETVLKALAAGCRWHEATERLRPSASPQAVNGTCASA